MSRFRFLLDENVIPGLREALHQQMPELVPLGESSYPVVQGVKLASIGTTA